MLESHRAELESALGHRFGSPAWLDRALTHSSHAVRQGTGSPVSSAVPGDNQQLEFLGDAVLGLIVSEHLVKTFPGWDEGHLSKSMARLVSKPSLSQAARRLQLGRYLKLGPGEEKTGGREKQGLLADSYEAVLAAIYLDAGLGAAAEFVRRSLLDLALRDRAEDLAEPDHKSALQEYLQERGLAPAEYRVIKESGPDHRKTFWIEVRVQRRALASAEGASKKEAEQAAARLALAQLRGSGPGRTSQRENPSP